MKTIFLKQLRLRNFKGITDSIITFYQATDILGANETGKSSLESAFYWLLTGKDEFDRKDYEIKNTSRKELNSQAHEVEGIIYTSDDGLEFEYKLKRVFLERWEKQKGESHKTFKGHKTDFYINDVPCNATEYQAKIDEIIPANIIKLVTNPYYFNTLPWEKQRAGLLQIAGEITNKQIFDQIATPENDFSTLIMVLNSGKSIEKYKDELKAKKKLLADKAIEFAPRIDEARRNKPEEKDWPAIEKQIDKINKQVEKIDAILFNASNALKARQKDVLEKQRLLHVKQTDLQNIKFKITTDVKQKQTSGAQEINNIERLIQQSTKSIEDYTKQLKDNLSNREYYKKQIADKEAIVVQMRSDWDKINKEAFQFDDKNCICPTCKQSLPEADIESKKESLLKNFNEDVRKRKQAKVDYSNQVKVEVKQIQDTIDGMYDETLQQSISTEQSKINELQQKLSILRLTETKRLPTDVDVAVDELLKHNADALNLQDEIKDLEAEIATDNEALNNQQNTDKEKLQKQTLEAELKEHNKELAIKETIEKTDERIAQLIKEEEANAQEIASIERHEFEIEKFTRAKMDILESRVNKLFRYVKFRLFEIQVNGGIAETCVCEYEGVPYPTLNTAAKLLSGLDILETLSNFYRVHAPVFCDNRESVTWIPETSSQIISIYVSAPDKILRVQEAGHKPSSKMQAA